jgi:hypothetical protein
MSDDISRHFLPEGSAPLIAWEKLKELGTGLRILDRAVEEMRRGGVREAAIEALLRAKVGEMVQRQAEIVIDRARDEEAARRAAGVGTGAGAEVRTT